ncbi:GFA family protein [Aquimonas voraii]|uniref:Uncharacterized conserved protein n=1 Tax=Aquimonas voraii TaxID=265719 RepID=A0A1G6UJZ4_9GAMM|nr:GFA family protein [Aquimonas voraii]SDD40877.1 Uncharacterized conserved protein [Aquimonas voraii]
MPDEAYRGSCLCGAVAVEVLGGISDIIHCHCSRCRKASGTAFATNGFIRADGFRIVKGETELRRFESAPGKHRHFCGRCGSPVFSANAADPERLRIRLGILDSAISERPISHNFVSSRACWDDLDARLPRYEAYEPSRTAS